MESEPGSPADPNQLTLFELEELVDKLYERTDAAIFITLNAIAEQSRMRYIDPVTHMPYDVMPDGSLRDPRDYVNGDDW